MTTTNADVTLQEKLRVISATPEWGMGEFNRVLIVIWNDAPTLERFRQRQMELESLVARFPGRCALVEVVEPAAKPPPSEGRVETMRGFAKLGSNLSALAFQLEGSALRAALNRAVITGMTFLIPQAQPTKVFKQVDATGVWVKEKIGETHDAFVGGLREAVDGLRSAMRAG